MQTILRARKVRILVAAVLAAIVAGVVAGIALAAHESANRFDLAVGPAGPADADGNGYSIYNPDQDNWDSRVTVEGLNRGFYTFYAEGPAPNNPNRIVKTPVCVLEILANDARRSCGAFSHAEPAFATANVRRGIGRPNAAIVLTATGSTDNNNTVQDGEIERAPVAEESGGGAT